MDLNDYLKQVTTAPADKGAGSETWLRGRKRKAERGDAGEAGEPLATTARSEGAVGLDIEQLRVELAREHSAAAAEARRRGVDTSQVSEQESAKRAHLILEYVMTRELGGRQNATRGESRGDACNDWESDLPPSRSRLAAERAHLTASAAFDIEHLVHETQQGVGAYSEVHKRRTADGVLAYRRTLSVCDMRKDLVGGLTSGKAPHLRAYARKVVEAGLRGEAWTRSTTEARASTDGGGVGGTTTAATTAGAAATPAPIVLFGGSGGEGSRSDSASPAFSLDQFLNADMSEDD